MKTILLLLLCLFAIKAEEIVTLEPGIYNEVIGEMKIIDSQWNMVINFNLTELTSNIEKTKTVFADLKKFCVYMRHHKQDANCFKEVRIGTDLIRRLENDDLRVHDLLGKSRVKRGFFNIIGSGLKFFFGTMDSTDAEKIGSKLIELKENNLESDHLLNDQIQIVNETFHMTEDTLKHVLYNEAMIKENSDKIHELSTTMNTRSILENSISFQRINSLFHILYGITNNDLQNFERFLTDIHSNILNTKIISFTKLLNEIKKVETKIPKDLELMLDLEDPDIEVLFKFLKLGYIYNKNSMFVIIQIPLTHREIYKIMDLHPIPKCENNTCIALEVSNDIYAITEINSNHVRMEQQFFKENCKQMNNIFYCAKITTIYHEIENNCETAILFQNKPNIKIFCKEKAFPLNKKLVIKLNTDNSYLIISSNEEKTKLKCKKSEDKIINLKNSMRIKINRDCKLYLKTMILKFIHNSQRIEINSTLFDKIDIEFDTEIAEIMNTLNRTEILPHVLNFEKYRNLGSNINKLKQEIEAKMHKEELKTVKSTNIIIDTILFTLLIVVILIIIFKCYKNKTVKIVEMIKNTVEMEMTEEIHDQKIEREDNEKQPDTTVSRFKY